MSDKEKKETQKKEPQEVKKFPKGGTYAQQTAFVNSLPPAQSGRLTETVQTIASAPNPFKVPKKAVENGVEVTVYKQSISELTQSPADNSDDEEEGETIPAVAQRTVNIREGKKTDTVSLFIAGEDQGKSIKIDIAPDGSIGRVKSKKIPMAEMLKYLLMSNTQQECFVVKATGNNQKDPDKPEDRGDVYTTFTRSGNKDK